MCYEIPYRPWQSISADLFELHGLDYPVITDRYSNFFEVDMLMSNTSKRVIEKLKPHLARYRLPERITTHNGPQFDCREFQQFAEQYQFEHIRTSPQNPPVQRQGREQCLNSKANLKEIY